MSSPLVGASHQRLQGEQNPLCWEQFAEHPLGCILWATQVRGHAPAPEPFFHLYHSEWCFVFLGFHVGVLSSSGSKSPRFHGEQNPLFCAQFTKHSLVHIMGKTSYRSYPSPRTIIYWYCTECCSVFVGFYVATTACWSVKSSSGSKSPRLHGE